MAIVVETGSSSATAESYVSVVDCDTYHADRAQTTWTGADAAKEAALRKAVEYLDGFYRDRWKGLKSLSTQALQWPRFGAVEDGYLISSNVIPQNLKDATCEAALRALTGTLNADLERGGLIESSEVSAGPVSVKTGYAPGASARTVYPVIDNLLSGLVTSSVSRLVVRG